MPKISRKFFKRAPDVRQYLNHLDPIDFFKDENNNNIPDVVEEPMEKILEIVGIIQDKFPEITSKCKWLPMPKMSFNIDIDLRDKCPGIFDQGHIGSCTANAGCLLYKAQGSIERNFEASRLFLYYVTRERGGDPSKDNGAMPITMMQAMRDVGVCKESIWPYQQSKVTDAPPQEARDNAGFHRITGVKNLLRQREVLIKCLDEGKPFIFGFNLGRHFRDRVGKSGVYRQPETDFIGAHCVCCVGYSRSEKAFLVANSWGTSWGLNGYFLFDESMICDGSITGNFWTFV